MKKDKTNKTSSKGVTLKTIGGMEFTVDAIDAPKVQAKKWSSYNSYGDKFYVRNSAGGIHLHHFIMGGVKTDEIIRFADKNPLNCRRSNLIVSKRISKKIVKSAHKLLKTSAVDVVKNNEKISKNFIKAGGLKEVQAEVVPDSTNGSIEFPGIRSKTVYEAVLVTPTKEYSFGTWNNIVEAMKAYNKGVIGVNSMTKKSHPLIPTSDITKMQNKINKTKTDSN